MTTALFQACFIMCILYNKISHLQLCFNLLYCTFHFVLYIQNNFTFIIHIIFNNILKITLFLSGCIVIKRILHCSYGQFIDNAMNIILL